MACNDFVKKVGFQLGYVSRRRGVKRDGTLIVRYGNFPWGSGSWVLCMAVSLSYPPAATEKKRAYSELPNLALFRL